MARAFHGHAHRSGPIITSTVVHLSTAFTHHWVYLSAAFYTGRPRGDLTYRVGGAEAPLIDQRPGVRHGVGVFAPKEIIATAKEFVLEDGVVHFGTQLGIG